MQIQHHTFGLGRIATQMFVFGIGIVCMVVVCLGALPALAGTTQVALFTGFGATPGTGTGMDALNSELSTLGLPDYVGQVFSWSNQQAAFDWLQQFEDDRSTLVIVGHSFGGNGALQLAGEYLLPVDIDVDLTVQIDSVSNPNPGSNSSLPANVEVGYNYYQNSRGFFEPQGEDFVSGALNFNTEVLFNDTSITHTSLDDDHRLHTLIGQHIFDSLNRENADFDSSGSIAGADFRTWQIGFGTTGSATLSSGDANGDGDIDDEDLWIWQQQYGNLATRSAVRVPEPTDLVRTVGLVLCGFAWKRNRS